MPTTAEACGKAGRSRIRYAASIPLQMRADQMRNFEVLQLVSSPAQLVVSRPNETESIGDCVHRLVRKLFASKHEDVDDPRMPAAGNPKVGGSNPPPATKSKTFKLRCLRGFFIAPCIPRSWVHWVQQRDSIQLYLQPDDGIQVPDKCVNTCPLFAKRNAQSMLLQSRGRA